MVLEADADADPAWRVLGPLWHGLIGYRVVALGYAAALVASNHSHYQRPATAVAVLVAIGLWTAITAVGYLRPARVASASAPRPARGSDPSRSPVSWLLDPGRLAVLDLAVTLAAIACTLLVETPERIERGAPVITTVWAAGPALALALAYGASAGLVGALLVQAAVLLVRGHLGPIELTDLLLLVAAAMAVGYAATVLRRSVDRLRRAIALRAALAERERLARSIHDGVLQVLSQVRRHGGELGGAAAELGAMAGEQEVALRTLITTGAPVEQPAGQLDLATTIAGLATSRVTVAVPGRAVVLPAHVVTEVVAAVRAALSNVRNHVGPDAPAWVLVEDLGGWVLVSVRDDGPGIPEGRLVAAEAEGRLGVSRSIRGRIEAIGGIVRCETGPGMGSEWSFEVRRDAARTERGAER